MKFRKPLTTLLKNFNSINTGITFYKNEPLHTLSMPSEATFSQADLQDEDNIEHTFSIYDLSQFLNTLSLFNEPEVIFKEKWLEISDGNQVVKYAYAPNSSVLSLTPEEAENYVLNDDTVVMDFVLTRSQIEQLLKAAGVLRLTNLGISHKGVRVFNSSSTSSDSNEFTLPIDIGTTSKQEFVIKIENMKIIPSDYQVRVDWRDGMGAIEFKTTELDIVKSLRYVIMLDVDTE